MKETLTNTAARPYWLSEPCPDWCTSMHDGGDWAVTDRNHGGVIRPVALTEMDMVRGAPGCWEIPEVLVQLSQHYRAAEAAVELSHGDLPDEVIRLTLAEAEALAANLAELVIEARKAASA